MPKIPEGLTPESKAAFDSLSKQLQPENLCWAGYVRQSSRAVRRRRAIIMREWRKLERSYSK